MTTASLRPAATAHTPFPGRDDLAAGLRQQLRGARKIFVLGIGMGWKSDDRLGTALADALAAKLPPHPNIRIACGGEAPENFTGAVRDFAPSLVLLLDAVDHCQAPGTAFLADEDAITAGDMTSHHLPLKLLMRFLASSIPCRVVLVGVQPLSLRPGNRISAPVRRTLAPLAALLAAAVRRALRKQVEGKSPSGRSGRK